MCRYAEEDGLSPHLIFFLSLLLPLAYLKLQQQHFKFCDGSGGGDDDVDDDYLSVLLSSYTFLSRLKYLPLILCIVLIFAGQPMIIVNLRRIS